MKSKFKARPKYIISFILCILCACLCFSAVAPVFAAADPAAAGDPFWEELLDIYVENNLHGVTRGEAVSDMIRKLLTDYPELLEYMGDALIKSRDGYGGYYPEKLFSEVYSAGSFYGYGIKIDGTPALNGHKYHPVISEIFWGSPAEKAGLEPKDEIVKIGGTDLAGLGVNAVSHLLTACADKTDITVIRDGKPLTFSLDKAKITVPAMYFEIFEEEKKALIRIEHFMDTDEEMELFYDMYSLLSYLDYNGFENIVIDLRNNPGGNFFLMLECLNLFLTDEGTVLCSAAYKDGELHDITSSGDGFEFDKIAVLVNGRSASAAEIFALSLREVCGAFIIGEKTFGKGVGQESFTLSTGDIAMITTFEVISPKGINYNKKGVEPDIKISPAYKNVKKAEFGQLNFVNCRQIKKGSENKAVLALNQRLAAIGYLSPEDVSDKCTDKTVTAVEIFQRYGGLPAGINKIDYLFLERLNSYAAALSQSRYETGDAVLECAYIYIARGGEAAKDFVREQQESEKNDG